VLSAKATGGSRAPGAGLARSTPTPCARMAHLHDSGAGRARLGDLEGQAQCLAHRWRERLADGVVRSRHQPHLLRHRRRVPDLRSGIPSRRQSLHRQHAGV
jgi:hypothetical protein